MNRMLFRWIVTSLAIFMVPQLVPGVYVDGLSSALAAAAILGILNVLVKPLLVILTLPLTIFTLGLFLLVINALVFQWVSALVPGFHVDTFGSAFLAALVVSLVSWFLNFTVRKEGGARVVVVRPDSPRRVRDLNP